MLNNFSINCNETQLVFDNRLKKRKNQSCLSIEKYVFKLHRGGEKEDGERERKREMENRRKGEAVIERKEKIVDIFIVYKVHVYARNCLPVRSLSPLGEVGRPLGERSRGRRPPLALPVSSGV